MTKFTWVMFGLSYLMSYFGSVTNQISFLTWYFMFFVIGLLPLVGIIMKWFDRGVK